MFSFCLSLRRKTEKKLRTNFDEFFLECVALGSADYILVMISTRRGCQEYFGRIFTFAGRGQFDEYCR